MAAKRTAAKVEAQHGLTKEEACKALQVAPTADEELIMQAYWHQARKVRVLAARDPEARAQLDELNRAYLVLNPARGEAPLSNEAPPLKQQRPNEFMVWLKTSAQQIGRRWRRAPEIAVLSGTTALLGFMALSAGADPIITMLALVASGLAIVAPWRQH